MLLKQSSSLKSMRLVFPVAVAALLLLIASAIPLVASAASLQEKKGITLQSTRVLYSAAEKNGITFKVTNNTTIPYLLQSRVLPWNSAAAESSEVPSDVPFIVLPPLQRIEPNEDLSLLIRLTRDELPKDRESVFILSLKAIPSQAPAAEEARLILAMQNNLKMFYRPIGLPSDDIEYLAKKLRFQKRGDQLTVTNSTPFYITFYSLSVGDKEVAGSELANWLPPFGQHSYPLPKNASGKVKWRLIDAISVVSPPQQSVLAE
ncbi:molecular chaperone [Serratia microhaemolytica]|uniref:fimbrial biogenesis chaperone n=1 Tax=Serratia microhaemolytica TaxID=2675110 RepID=UPI001F0C47A0|nr:molecular chaperone [Serratia microhaemolytica]